MRLGSDGRMEFVAYADFSDATLVDAAHTIDGSTIITPAGSYGAWPGWEPQRDGLVTAVDINHGYDSFKDAWDGSPITYQDPNAVAIHHTRGKVQATIQPYSHANPEPTTDLAIAFKDIAGTFLAAFAREYAVITLRVSFKNFDILCGDTVTITHRLIPAGDGTRGVDTRVGMCIERRWNMDPRSEDGGELKLIVYRDTIKGYAPSAKITTHTNTSGNTWALTIDPADALNIEWSTSQDGKIVKHFTVGDLVRVVPMDTVASSALEVHGAVTVTNTTSNVVTVLLADPWTPGGGAWVLEFIGDFGNDATAAQRRFMYVADDTYLAADGTTFARQLS